jgi:hypothetical protein
VSQMCMRVKNFCLHAPYALTGLGTRSDRLGCCSHARHRAKDCRRPVSVRAAPAEPAASSYCRGSQVQVEAIFRPESMRDCNRNHLGAGYDGQGRVGPKRVSVQQQRRHHAGDDVGSRPEDGMDPR